MAHPPRRHHIPVLQRQRLRSPLPHRGLALDQPARPLRKARPPIVANNERWVGPGHGTVIDVAGQDHFVYHAWTNAGDGTHLQNQGRHVLVDRIDWIVAGGVAAPLARDGKAEAAKRGGVVEARGGVARRPRPGTPSGRGCRWAACDGGRGALGGTMAATKLQSWWRLRSCRARHRARWMQSSGV